ncbi:MAG: VTT domain-containing protein [Clostridium sp.]
MNKKLIIFIFITIALLFSNNYYGWSSYLLDSNNIDYIKEMVNENLFIASLIYIVLTIAGCTLLALPGATFAIFAGLIFGPILGIFLCLIATTLGASLAFLVGRFFLKDSLKPMIEKSKYLNQILFNGSEKSDFILLMVTRLVPIFPYNLQNFAYGITNIGFLKYTFLTFIFMFPGVTFITIGSAGLTATNNKWLYFTIAFSIFVIVLLLGMILQKKYIKTRETY